MNITREIWSNTYHCGRKPKTSLGLEIALGLMAMIPIIFYTLAYTLSHKQESDVLQRKAKLLNHSYFYIFTYFSNLFKF